MDKQDHTLLFVDIETGGTNIYKHPIIEIAAIAVSATTWEELDTIEMKIDFRVKDADPVALGINKFSPHAWRHAFEPRDAAKKFAGFCRKHATVERVSKKTSELYFIAQLVGHNAEAFDGPFLHQWYRKQHLFLPGTIRVLCTKQLSMWLFEMNGRLEPPKDYKLETLCEYFGLPAPDHSALNDIRATVALARTIYQIQQTPTVTPIAA